VIKTCVVVARGGDVMTFHAFVMLCVDLLFVATATVGGVMLRDDFDLSLERMQSVTPHLLFSMVTAALAVTAFGQHRAIWRMATRFDYVRIIYVALVTVIGACALGFVWNRLEGVPRSLPLLQFGLMIGLMGGVREVVRLLYHRRQDVAKAGEVGKAVVARRAQILIVGLNPIAELYLRGVEEVGEAVEVVGILGRSERHIGRRVMACPVLGMPEDVEEVVRELEVEGVDVDRIVITVPDGKLSEAAHEALRRVERTGIALHRIAEGIGLGRSEPTTASRQGLCRDGIAEYSVAERALVSGNRYLRVKRWLDAVAALLLMAVLSPIYALVGLLALVDVGLPVLFSQRRPGRFGRPFRIYKFRTMSPAYDSYGRRVDEAKRSSWIGALLRRTRLDELPQLYNVLVGEMSFVGPRPLLPVDQRLEHKARLLVRPGITGWAQVAGGRIVSVADKAAMDVWYVKNASLALDLRIIARTFRMIIEGDRVNEEAIDTAWRELERAGICANWSRDAEGRQDLADAARVTRRAA